MTEHRPGMVPPPPGKGNAAAPTRADLDRLQRRFIKYGTRHKADLYVVDGGAGPVALKDFAAKPWLTRLIGRLQIGHEARAYRWVGPHPGLPRFYGRVDALALAIEVVDGGELVDAPERFSGRRRHLHGLRRVADHFLARGFLHLDSRGRRNVLLRTSGEIVVIDLAGSLWLPPDSLPSRLVRPLLRRFYRRILSKWRKLLTPGGRSFRDEKSAAAKLFGYLRKPHHLAKDRRKRRAASSAQPPAGPAD